MKLILSILSVVIFSAGIYSQWFTQTSGTTNVLTNIYFIDANTGTAIGLLGTIRRTTNGGLNWTVQSVPADNLYDVRFLNSNTGFICGDAVFYKTTNGGTSWSNPGAPVKLFRGTFFIDANTGYLCATGGEIDKTTNGGSTWSSLNTGTTQNLNNIYFIDPSTGFVSGFTGTILKTTNAGTNWETLSTGVTAPLFALGVVTDNIIYSGGEGGVLIKTTNGGLNWNTLNSGITGRITNFSFLNANTGTGSSHSNFIIRTTNGGLSWVSQVSPVAGQDWYGVSFVNIQTGFISGDGGNIIKTTNGGFQIPGSPNLTLPVNGALNVSLTPLLDWDSITTAKTYQVQIDTDTNYTSPELDTSFVMLSMLNVPSGELNNNIRYYWRVRGQSEGGIGPWSANFNFRTIVALPNAPGLITPVNGASNISLTPFFDWDSTSPADSYTLQAALDTSFTDPPVWTSGIIHSFLNLITPPLNNNLRYYWRVNATNIAGTGPWSAIFNFTTLLGMPAAPTLLTPANFATGVSLTPLLDWVEDISATNYQVQVSLDSTFTSQLWDTTGFNVSQVTVRAGLLTNVQTYFWRVRTTNPIGTGPWSEPFRFMTLLIPPVAPQLVDPPNGAIEISTTPTLNWDSVQYASTFRVQLSTDSTFTIPHLINAGDLTFSQYNVPGGVLSNNTTYFWRVNASNNAGTGPYSQVWKFRTVISPPVAAPTLLSPPNGAINQPLNVTLDWNDVFGTSGYKLLVSTDSLFNSTLLDSTITPSQFTIPAGVLSGSSIYYWRVRGFNVGGFGPWSVTWRFTTQIIGIEPISTIIPDNFMLYNNYPNPFNPVTNINFDIPSGVNSNTELIIYDITGRIITVLVNTALKPGKYSVNWNASGYSSGVYFFRLTSGSFSDIKKMVVVK